MIKLTIMIPNYNQEALLKRALQSIPKRADIEVLIIDDCSTDSSLQVIQDGININRDEFGHLEVKCNETNQGCGFGKHWAYEKAQGEYIITLDSDDYLYTERFTEALDRLYRTQSDMIFISNKINDGGVGSDNTRKATGSYFVRREFLNRTGLNYRATARRAGDYELTRALQTQPHTEEVGPYIAYHYNYPREGSIVGNYEHQKEKAHHENSSWYY